MTNISRVDSFTAHGWLVRLQKRGESYIKFFSDFAHGGENGSKAKAEKYRNEKIGLIRNRMVSVL